jgi:hypothetical protein
MSAAKGVRKKLSSIKKLARVGDGLYVGNKDAAADADLLKHLNVTHILNIGGGKNRFGAQFEYCRFGRISDSTSADILALLPACCLFIHRALSKGGAVLVHCKGGISRSPSVTIAYLLWSKQCATVAQALARVRAARPAARPNAGFLAQLEAFAASLGRS